MPQSNDRTLPAAITLTDMLTAGSDGFLTPYDGAEIPCEMPDCPYVAYIVAGEFMALCCYDCALYHAHSCSRVYFPSCFSAPGGALPASVGESGERKDDDTDAIAAAVAASLTFGTPPGCQRLRPGELLTAAQLAGVARQPDQSASNADVCDFAAAIAASLTDLQPPDPGAAVAAPVSEPPVSTVPLGVSSSSTTVDADRALAPRAAAPAIRDDSSKPGIPDSTSRHVAHLRTLSNTRATQSSLAAEDFPSRTSLNHAERSSALHL